MGPDLVGKSSLHLSFSFNLPLTRRLPLQLEFPFNIMQPLALALLKLSVLFFYRRLFVGRIFDIASWTLIGVVIAWGVTFVIALMTMCGASITANFGTLNDLMTSCSHSFAILIALSASDVAVDLIILTIPLPLVSFSARILGYDPTKQDVSDRIRFCLSTSTCTSALGL